MSSFIYRTRRIIYSRSCAIFRFGDCNRKRTSKALQLGGVRFSSDSHFRSVFDHASVTCLPGLESVLSDELQMLQIHHDVPKLSQKNKKNGEIRLKQVPTTEDLFQCCLYLGTATQVRLSCASFGARGLPELKRKIARIPWTNILKPDIIENGNLEVRVVSRKSKLYHTGAIRDRVLQAIRENFGKNDSSFETETENDEGNEKIFKRTGTNDSLSASRTLRLDVTLLEDQVRVSINAYPTPLHQRGYRKQVAKAPLREDIAYAMLFSAGWLPAWSRDVDKTSRNISQGLVDPFCGSGTIAIEGAAMMLGLPPGRFRCGSPFQGTVLEDETKWSRIVRQSLALSDRSTKSFPISASDRDAGAVEAIKANAKRAGVLDALTIEGAPLLGQRWFQNPPESPSSFLIVTNPPYGKRISSKASTEGLLKLYQSLGHTIQRLAENQERRLSGIVLTNNSALLSRSGVSFPYRTSFKTFHGGLKVSAMKFDVSNKV